MVFIEDSKKRMTNSVWVIVIVVKHIFLQMIERHRECMWPQVRDKSYNFKYSCPYVFFVSGVVLATKAALKNGIVSVLHHAQSVRVLLL